MNPRHRAGRTEDWLGASRWEPVALMPASLVWLDVGKDGILGTGRSGQEPGGRWDCLGVAEGFRSGTD